MRLSHVPASRSLTAIRAQPHRLRIIAGQLGNGEVYLVRRELDGVPGVTGGKFTMGLF